MANPKRWPIGLQSSVTGKPTGIGEVIKELTRHNIAFFSASTDSFSILTDLQNARKAHPEVPHTANLTLTGYWPPEDDAPDRYHYNVPEYTKRPSEKVARRHWDMVEKREAINDPDRSPIDWSVPCIWVSTWNEIRDYVGWYKKSDESKVPRDVVEGFEGNADLIGWHAVEVGKEAVRRDYRWAAFGFSGGSPEEGFWEAPGVLAYLRLCEKYPDQLGVALHEYSLTDTIINRPDHIGRFKLLHDTCDRHGIRRPVIQFKEFGWRDIRIPDDPAVAMRELIEVAAMYAEHPNIHGAAIWTVHPWQGSSVHHQVAALIPHLRDAALTHAREIPTLKPPAKPAKPPKPEVDVTPIAPVPTPVTTVGIVIAPAGLNLRSSPTTAGDDNIIGLLALGSRVEIIGQAGDWYEVRAGGDHGFVYAGYVTINNAPLPDPEKASLESMLESGLELLEAGPEVEIGFVSAPAGLNLREEPITGEILKTLPENTRVELLELANGWYRVRADGREGYVSADWIRVGPPAAVMPGTPMTRKTRSVIGIHGAPGGAAPPRHLWGRWADYMNEMGIKWFKQCETGDDTGDGSIFRWVLHLKENGIEPIVRFLMNGQFPSNLEDRFFRQMERYAAEDVRWVELGNEPNLNYEWQESWRGRYEGEWPNGHWAEEPRMRWGNPEAINTLARVWIEDATRAAAVGAKPAFYAFGPTDWGKDRPHGHFSSTQFTDLVVARLAAAHRAETIRLFRDHRAWIAVHVAKYEKDLSYNPFSEDAGRPWDMCLRGYEVVLNAFRRHFGSDLDINTIPIISTEGGVFTPEHRNSIKDPGRVPDNDEEHARQTVEMFRYVESSTPLTAMCPWCIAEGHAIIGHGVDLFRHHGWFKEENGHVSERPVLNAMRRLRQEKQLAGSLESMTEGGLESLAEPAPQPETGTAVTVTITIQVKVEGQVDAKDIVVNVTPRTE